MPTKCLEGKIKLLTEVVSIFFFVLLCMLQIVYYEHVLLL